MEVTVVVMGRLPEPTRRASKKRPLTQSRDVYERFALRVALGESVLSLKQAIGAALEQALQADVSFSPEVQLLTAGGRLLADMDSIGAALLDVRMVVCALDFPEPVKTPAPESTEIRVSDQGVAMLVGMGFSIANAQKALACCSNSVEASIAYLTENIMPEMPYLLWQTIQGCPLDELAALSLAMMTEAVEKAMTDANAVVDESDAEESKTGEALADAALEAALQRLQSLGFSRNDALTAYMACDQDESAAANCLLDSRDASKRRRYDDNRPSRDIDGNWKDQQKLYQGDDSRRPTPSRSARAPTEGYSEARQIEPTSSLMLKGLPFALTNAELVNMLAPFGPQYVRIITNKVTGESRGFAFVDFNCVESAQAVVQYYAKEPLVIFDRVIAIGYSETAKNKPFAHAPPLRCDWLCELCHVSNFAKRTACFKCGYPKTDNAVEVPQAYSMDAAVSAAPSHILVVRGLPSTATETEILHMFGHYPGLKEVRLVRDRVTSVSRGFGFVEFDSVDLATAALTTTGSDFFFLGTNLRLAYAQESGGHMAPRAFGMSGGNVQALVQAAMEQAQWSMANTYTTPMANDADVNALVDAAAAAVPTAPRKEWPLSFEEAGGSFVYVGENGLYYDGESMFYYDPTAKIYYNSYTGVYFTYDAATAAFSVFTAPPPVDDALVPTTSAVPKKKAKAKSLSISFGIKTPASKPLGVPIVVPPQPMPAATIPTAAKKKHADEIAKWSHQQKLDPATAPVADAPVAAPVVESAQPAVCLLCRRKFNSLAQLRKHETLSELHKENVLKAKQAAVPVRERVVERGEPITTAAATPVEAAHVDKPLNDAVNIGGKMLKSMGWKAGEGLGKLGTGITAPIAAVGKIAGDTSGLGGASLTSNPSVLAASTQRDKINQLVSFCGAWEAAEGLITRARFDNLSKP
ncbi:hypothetical protein ACHHYP_02336 [Achlya hypogyna]|uniref:RNA-binding protein n=1 Tax=Achlya hypogyna TaxID=1202772 RepID=A0A1V9Z798_ACHHY|nr:hypothetical protein ACHHYP_02336 [Achlya hypogyna]